MNTEQMRKGRVICESRDFHVFTWSSRVCVICGFEQTEDPDD